MNRPRFEELLLKASRTVVAFTREFVWNPIPDAVQYRVYPNMSYDKHPDGRILTDYPEDSKLARESLVFSDPSQVVDFLWREGRVPEWIDVQIKEVSEQHATVELICCGRYTADENAMYYSQSDMGPFGVKGPALPPEWKSDRPKEKFDLYWLKHNLEGGG